MKIYYWIFSIGFALFGLLPYNKAYRIDTTKPNQLVIRNQECGCPCANGIITAGKIEIPSAIKNKYSFINTTQINLEIEDLVDYNMEIMHSPFYVKGQVTGIDTILCNPDHCELIPHFKVKSWSLADPVARVWTFPVWAGALFLINLIFVLPVLMIVALVQAIKKNRKK